MKWGLVLEGGASRTYFTCGVLDGFLDRSLYSDYMIGVSAGISFGVSYVSRQRGRNYNIMMKYQNDSRYMGVRHLLNRKNRSYYNLDFVFEEIPNKLLPFDFNVFDNRSTRCRAVVTRLDNGCAEYMEMPKDRSFRLLRATCALPLLFKPIEINGVMYMDGGVSDSLPFKKAFEDGCDKIIAILTHPNGYIKGYESATPLVKAAYRKYPRFVESFLSRPERYNSSLSELDNLRREGKALILTPRDTYGVGRTESRPEKLVKLYEEGLNCFKENEAAIKTFISPQQSCL